MVAKAGACTKDNGYWLHGTGISVLTYADNLVDIGKSGGDIQFILNRVCNKAQGPKEVCSS